MKKVLFGTTALVAVGMAAPAMAAEPIKLSVGGYMWQWAGMGFNRDVTTADIRKDLGKSTGDVWQGGNGPMQNYITAREYGNFATATDAEIHFKGSTKLDNGLNITIQFEIEAERTSTSTGRNADQQWMELSGGWGALSIGERFNVQHRMHNSAPQAGTIFADTFYFAYPMGGNAQGGTGNVTSTAFYWTSLEGINQWGRTAHGIDYVTPRVWGLQLGASYTPTTASAPGSTGAFARGIANQESSGHDAISVALNYTNKFGPVTVSADTGWGRVQSAQSINQTTLIATGTTSASSSGLKLSGWGFTVGGSYMRIFDSLKTSETSAAGSLTNTMSLTSAFATSFDGYVWDVGVMYETGPYAIGLAYNQGNLRGAINPWNNGSKDNWQVAQLTAKYTMGPGVDLVGSAAWLDWQDQITVGNPTGGTKDYNNSWAWTVYTGVKLAF
ncbi:MAG: porin [Rhodospirillales bacterium]|nr:porin [Rhodospirillales bacterium]